MPPTIFTRFTRLIMHTLRAMKNSDLNANALQSGLRADGSLRRVRTQDDNVSINARHRVIRNTEIHFTVLTESRDDLTRPGVERDQATPRGEKDSRKFAT